MAKVKQKNKNNKKKNKKSKNNNNNNDVVNSSVPDIIITRSDDGNSNDCEFQQQQQQEEHLEQQQDRLEVVGDNQNNEKKPAATSITTVTKKFIDTTITNNSADQDEICNDDANHDNVGDVNNDEIIHVNNTNTSSNNNNRVISNDVNNSNIDNSNDNSNSNLRQGTISSARFNILCTMVGGGSLSVPLAFEQSGTLLVAPIVLFVSAVITEFCFRIIIECTRKLQKQRQLQRQQHENDNNNDVVGNDTYESIAGAAFGPKGFIFAKTLVTLMCFAGSVGYAVLLRDMLQPITDFFVSNNQPGPTLANNITMWIIVILITPVCTLKNLTSLKDLGAASMAAILVLVSCVTFRSVQCNFPNGILGSSKFVHNPPYRILSWDTIYNYHLFPQTPANSSAAISSVVFAMLDQLLNVFPLYVSVYVCHYNLPPVQNELKSPSKERVGTWLRTTTWSATLFYLIIGISGSMYTNCIPETELPLKGNILLSFDENDPLLFIGRMCLAITITLAFPLLTVPARDILLRTFFPLNTNTNEPTAVDDVEASLRQPLLLLELEVEGENNGESNSYQLQRERERHLNTTTTTTTVNINNTNDNDHSFAMRLTFAILVFWSSVLVASCVDGIDTVWDLLGSSLSILLCFLIPAGSYIIISNKQSSFLQQNRDNINNNEDEGNDDDENNGNNCCGYSKDRLSMYASWVLVWVYTPMMFISTINAVYKTFFS